MPDLSFRQDIADQLPEGWNWQRFCDWLNFERTKTVLTRERGENWTLEQALELLTRPPMSKQESARRRARRSNAKKGVGLAEDEGPEEDSFDPKSIYRPLSNAEDKLSPDAGTLIGEDEFNKEVDRKAKEILAGHTDVQPQDRDLVYNLARSTISAKIYADAESRETSGVKKNLYNTLYGRHTKLISEFQKTLRIDRATRQKDTDQLSDVEKILARLDQMGKQATEEDIQVTHCNILIGWISSEFKEFPFQSKWQCPKCNEFFEVNHEPTEEQIATAREPAFVAEEENSYDPGVEELDADNLSQESGPVQG